MTFMCSLCDFEMYINICFNKHKIFSRSVVAVFPVLWLLYLLMSTPSPFCSSHNWGTGGGGHN